MYNPNPKYNDLFTEPLQKFCCPANQNQITLIDASF